MYFIIFLLSFAIFVSPGLLMYETQRREEKAIRKRWQQEDEQLSRELNQRRKDMGI